MVENSGTHMGTGTIRPLNVPLIIQVQADARGFPTRVTLNGRQLTVEKVTDRWRIDDEWWREVPVSRMYFQILLHDGRRLTLFRDLLTGYCYQQNHA